MNTVNVLYFSGDPLCNMASSPRPAIYITASEQFTFW